MATKRTKIKKFVIAPGAVLSSPDFGQLVVGEITLGKNHRCKREDGRKIVLSESYLRSCKPVRDSVPELLNDPDSPDTQPELDEEPAIDSEGNVILGLCETTGQAAGEDADVDEEIETPTESDDSSEMVRAYTRIMSQEAEDE